MQISFFDGDKPFKFTKPIRLITLFSGYDSQALALKYLGVPFEHYHTCEWAIPSIQALKDLHFDYDNGDYSVGLSKTDLVDILYGKGVSADYNQPLTKEQLNRYGETKLRTIFNNIVATRNRKDFSDIQLFHFDDSDKVKELDACYTNNYFIVNPMAYWTTGVRDRYIAKHNIEVNPVYKKYGLKRCGCLMCCMASPKDRQKEAKLFPKYAENLRRLCEKIAKSRTKDISGGLYEIYLR